MKNLLIAQSGGPTAAINASLAGVMEAAMLNEGVDGIYGAVNGIQGVFEEKIIDLKRTVKNTADIELLCQTPSSALGSCRYILVPHDKDEKQYEEFIRIMRKYHISYFIYIGGNDSMDTVFKLSEYCREKHIPDVVITGVPKTIDNDLAGTDHCPGFGSAAKYVATTFAELKRDISVYSAPAVTVVEIMGRNAGWLTAASALSRVNGGSGPELIYLCEHAFEKEIFLSDIKEVMKREEACLVAVSEGLKDKTGRYISEESQSDMTDAFGHKYISGTGRILEELIRQEIGCKVRSIELNLMQRCAAHIASETDLNEARMLGRKALQCAAEGQNGVMASIHRLGSQPYAVEYTSVPAALVANHERTVPPEMIHENGHDVTEQMMQYLFPLIQGEPRVLYENGIPVHLFL